MRRIAVCAGLLLASNVAAAQTAVSPADALIAQGVEARRSSDDARALALFEQAYALDHAPRSLAQIALAEQALGRWRSADAHLRDVLAAATDPWVASHRDALDASLGTIDRHLGSLDVATNTPGGDVFVDGQRLASLPFAHPIRVGVGSTVIAVHAPGFRDAERTVDIAAGQLTRETFTLVPLLHAAGETTTVTTAPQTAPPSGGISAGPFVVGGAGVLSFMLAGLFYGLRQGALGPCSVQPDAIHCPPDGSVANVPTARAFNTATNVSLVAGAALVVGGAAWLLIDRVTHHTERRASIRMQPLAQGAWVGIEGTL